MAPTRPERPALPRRDTPVLPARRLALHPTSLEGETVEASCACGRDATANGRECPAHFRARIRSINLDGSVIETRTRTAGHSEAASEIFGEDAKERMLEETKGMGYARTAPDGTVYHRKHKTGEIEALTERQVDETYLPLVDEA